MKKGIDYIGVGVGAIIINKDKKIFCHKRGQKAKNEQGKWDMPGGSVEFNEKIEDAIIREIIEEHDFVIEPIELLCVTNHILKKEGQHWVSPSFICKIKNGEPKILEPEKCEAIGWFTMDEIKDMDLSMTTKHDYEMLLKKYPNGLPCLYV